jgi:hypothetical protein
MATPLVALAVEKGARVAGNKTPNYKLLLIF